ncbi:GAP family protein [Antribacter gilvus]|uniref:GAP family protein n=1 Tax=Antribacter gilvus TaxID=2304675 RepID=UPI000F76D126|nr:GAP family protein [Antribacter gilvus]
MDLATADLGLAALFGPLALLALVDSTSFGTLLIPVWLLMAPGRPRAGRLLVYLGTVAVFYLAVGIAVMFGAGFVLDRFGDALESPTAYAVQLVLGVALFVLSFRFDRKRSEARRARQEAEGKQGRLSRWRERALGADGGPASGSALPLMGLALGAVSLEVATMLPYLAAIGMLATSSLAPATSVAVLAGYCVVMVLPALLLLAGRLAVARAVDPLLRRLDAWLTRNAEEMTGWVLGILGALLVLDAVGNLGLGDAIIRL